MRRHALWERATHPRRLFCVLPMKELRPQSLKAHRAFFHPGNRGGEIHIPHKLCTLDVFVILYAWFRLLKMEPSASDLHACARFSGWAGGDWAERLWKSGLRLTKGGMATTSGHGPRSRPLGRCLLLWQEHCPRPYLVSSCF